MRRILSVIASFAVASCAPFSQGPLGTSYGTRADADLARLRAVTQPFQSLDAAVAAGYPRIVVDCFVDAHHGAMGYHHVNRASVDGTADVDHPEILLYEKMPDGSYRLNGVEFIVPYRFWPRDSVPPEVIGQRMKHEDNLNYWYLHVWAWRPNANGMFADFHPDVQCPPGAKVYVPSSESAPPQLH
jgi:hypothetical protein